MPNDARSARDQKKAPHESASEAAAAAQEETEVARKTLEMDPETATAANKEKELAVASHMLQQQHSKRQGQTRRR